MTANDNTVAEVLFNTINTQSGVGIGHITLNRVGALNALNLNVISHMREMLRQWQYDPLIGAVFIDAQGDKAFCAGGDIMSLFHAMQAQSAAGDVQGKSSQDLSQQELAPEYAAFFEQEYALDYYLHTFPKPIIVWGQGIIMGGGLGIFAAGDIKVVCETSRIAMPESSIGLVPDVGASYFLNQLPSGMGLFLGLTGANINADDALAMGLASHGFSHADKSAYLAALKQLPSVNIDTIRELSDSMSNQSWQCSEVSSEANSQVHRKAQVDTVSNTGKRFNSQATQVFAYREDIALMSMLPSIDAYDQALQTFFSTTIQSRHDDVWLKKTQQAYDYASPLSKVLIFEQLKRGQNMDLQACFHMELRMVKQCGVQGEFQEGVRALLVDKDRQAKWLYDKIDSVPANVVAAHF